MEYQRILCTFLHHSPTHVSQSTRQVLPALLAHCYNPEGLSRSIVATIAREISSLNDQMGYGLSVDEVQNYWFAITLDYQPVDPSADHKHLQHPTAPDVSHTDARDPQAAFSHPSVVPHHPNPNVDLLLATAYNNVIFTWITDFLLYPTKKRADLLIPRHRTHPIPRRPQEYTARDDDSNVSQPSRKIHRLPRRTPPPTANTTDPDDTITTATTTADVHMEIEGEDNSGLDGCRIINDVMVEANYPAGHNHSAGLTTSDAAYAQWDGAQNDYNGEDWFGEALDLRMGKYRETLKQDLIRRDGPLCAASKQSLDTFCTQIIPESADPHRFFRFRRMVSVFFAGQYDHLLEPLSQSNTSNSAAAMEVDHSLGSDPSQDNRRSRRRGHYPISENILRSSRNTINMSEKWMRWFDEGRFTIRERGGQFYIICLDPTLYHDPSFSRQGIHPNDPWESAHLLRLEVGATNTRQRNEVSNPSRLAPIAQASGGGNGNGGGTIDVQEAVNNSLPPLHSVTSAHLPQQNQHQLPTPTPTPTSPPPILSLPPLVEQSPLSRMSYTRTRMQTQEQDQFSGMAPGIKIRPLTTAAAAAAAGQMEHESERAQEESAAKRSLPAITVSTRLLKRAANRNSSPHPYAPKSNNRGSSRWQSHSELHNIRAQAHSHSRSTSSSSIYSLSSSSASSSSLSTQSTTIPSRHSIASLLNPKSSLLSQTSTIVSQLNNQRTSSLSSSSATTAIPIRKELWDVDALDPNLVRLHEQIVTAWWATGLAPEVNTQMHWVDNLPLPEMNIVVLGQPGFTSVLKHKLTLL